MRRNRRVRPSPCRLGRGEGRGGKCRRVRQPVQASEAVPLPTGTRGGRGREVQASAAAPLPAGTWGGRRREVGGSAGE